MSDALAVVDAQTVERVLLQGDLQKLTSAQKVAYYSRVCDSLGFNPLTRPFDYIVLNGKEQLYAKREATEQLRKLHNVSLVIVARELVEDTYIVTARASLPDGRTDESIGAKAIGNLKGEARANAMMTAETKAKRRVTLSICGLGMLDETEVADVVADVPPQASRPARAAKPKPAPESEPEPAPEPEPDPGPLPPAGFLYVVGPVRETPTKNPHVTRYTICLSSGEELTTINAWLATQAQQYRDARTPVRAQTKATQWGMDLTGFELENPTDPPALPLTADDIPF